MSYVALYRKYRPTSFTDVIGQEHITKALSNQIKTNQVGHAYLFCGSRGTGKTSTAKIFARAINCETPINGSACGKCNICNTNMEQSLDIVEIDAASNNGVDEIRNLRDQIKYPPVVGKYKVYIIDEVHMLSISAFNALLKTLEEPPSYVIFILATTEVHKLPATILSRCMRFDFKLISTNALTNLLKNVLKSSNIKFEDNAVEQIARAGEGSARDTLNICDRVLSYSGDMLKYDDVISVLGSVEKGKLANISSSLLRGDIGNTLLNLDEILKEGKSPLVLSKELSAYFRDLLLILTLNEDARKMVVVPNDVFEEMKKQSTKDNYATIIRCIEKLGEVEQELRFSVKPRMVLEICLIRTVYSNNIETRIDKIEKQLEGICLEDKKKINKILDCTNFPTKTTSIVSKKDKKEIAVFGNLLKQFKRDGDMLIYSLLTQINLFEIVDDILLIKTQDKSIYDKLNEKDTFEKIVDKLRAEKLNIKILLQENENEILIKKLKNEFGNKIIIKD